MPVMSEVKNEISRCWDNKSDFPPKIPARQTCVFGCSRRFLIVSHPNLWRAFHGHASKPRYLCFDVSTCNRIFIHLTVAYCAERRGRRLLQSLFLSHCASHLRKTPSSQQWRTTELPADFRNSQMRVGNCEKNLLDSEVTSVCQVMWHRGSQCHFVNGEDGPCPIL